MNMRYIKTSLHAIVGGIAALFLAGAIAADDPMHQVVNGVEIYLGVMPAEQIATSEKMRSNIPAGKDYYRVTIALFDATTGERITDAQVKARVSELALSGTEKDLEPLHVADAVSYGNYFRMPGTGLGIYRIRVLIRRADTGEPVETSFDFRHPAS